jgi:hypothetical protein
MATASCSTTNYGEAPLRVYHALNPHPALDPGLSDEEQRACEAAYRQLLVQGALAVLLPTEDLANDCLRILVTDIIADLIIGRAVAEKVCEPWFLHGAISKVVEIIASRATGNDASKDKTSQQRENKSRLEEFGLLASNTADEENHSPTKHQSPLTTWFWSLLQHAFIVYQFLRFIFIGLAQARQLAPRIRHTQQVVDFSTSPSSSLTSQKTPVSPMLRLSGLDQQTPRAVVNYRVFSCISTILHLSVRMPWLESSFGFWQAILCSGPGHLGKANSMFDK